MKTSLSSINLPSTLKSIGHACFDSTFIKEITIPGKVKKLENNMFAFCKNLTDVTLQEGLEEIGARCFNASAIKDIVIPSSVKSL